MRPEKPDPRAGVIAVAVAAVGFALFVAVLPRLNGDDRESAIASDVTPALSDSTFTAVPITDTYRPSTTMAVDATPTTTCPTTTTATVPVAPTTTLPPEDASPFRIAPPPGEDARIELELIADPVRLEGDSAIVNHGDEVTWTLRVTNTGSEFLWGVYAYLELSGPMRCDIPRLASGQSAWCTLTTSPQSGEHTAWVWATAWTETSVIGTDLRYPFTVRW